MTAASASLCLAVRNEEDCLADLVQELIVVDTGSTDRTRGIRGHPLPPERGTRLLVRG